MKFWIKDFFVENFIFCAVRLTNLRIDTLQGLYRHNFKWNKGNSEARAKAVMDILYHYSSTEEAQQHQYFPAKIQNAAKTICDLIKIKLIVMFCEVLHLKILIVQHTSFNFGNT